MPANEREWYVRMLPRLAAEEAERQADILRAAFHSDNDQYRNIVSIWRSIADGKMIGEHIDARGRPMTDSIDEFVAFWKGDPAMLQKYGRYQA
jgi:hypothetical protein